MKNVTDKQLRIQLLWHERGQPFVGETWDLFICLDSNESFRSLPLFICEEIPRDVYLEWVTCPCSSLWGNKRIKEEDSPVNQCNNKTSSAPRFSCDSSYQTNWEWNNDVYRLQMMIWILFLVSLLCHTNLVYYLVPLVGSHPRGLNTH